MFRSLWRRAASLLALGLATQSCAPDAGGGPTPAPPATGDAALERAAHRAATIAATQREGAWRPGYAIEEIPGAGAPGAASLFAGNPGMRFVTEFGERGPRVVSSAEGWSAALLTRSIGCAGKPNQLVRESLPGARAKNRVAYASAAASVKLREWYVNGPLGLEQGFTLDSSPCGGQKALSIEIEVEGLTPRATEAGDALMLVDAGGQDRLRYSDLYASDASGRPLPTRLLARHNVIELRVDIEKASFPIVVDPLIWVELQELSAPDAAQADEFGGRLAVLGNTAVIGATGDDTGNVAQHGSAYVFTKSGSTWSFAQKLTRTNQAANDYFGGSVALGAGTAVVGAPFATVGGKSAQGSAYVFVGSGAAWSEQQRLTAADGAANDNFGISVAVSGDTTVVGALNANIGAVQFQGAAYVFVRSGATWSFQQKLTAGDGAYGDGFGWSVGVVGDYALIGAPNHKVGAKVAQGGVYVFRREGTLWTPQAGLAAPDGQANEYFGQELVMDGTTALIRSEKAAYVFTRSGLVWSLQQKLPLPSNRTVVAVALAGNTAAVRLSRTNNATDTEYLFNRSGTTWTQVGPAGTRAGWGGIAILASDSLMVGDTSARVTANGQGAVYVSVLRKSNGDACSAAAECSSGNCVDSRCCNEDCTGPCGACSVAAGATMDGVCTLVPAGGQGSPACVAPLACIGTTPLCSLCLSDASCPSGQYCSADGTCQAQKPQGAACNLAAGSDCKINGCSACATGFCTEGYCCDQACSAGCTSCAAALTGGENGTCANLPAGTDAKNACEPGAGYPESCAGDGKCDGAGACRNQAIAGTACGDTTCTGSTVSGYVCNGTGQCQVSSVSCSPFVCSDDDVTCVEACVDDDDCLATAYCFNAACVPKKAKGDPCEEGRECATGQCWDGVCCITACEGQCEACGEPDTKGSCLPVLGPPRGGREPCGVASCDENGAVTHQCNGLGQCSQALEECGPYQCAGAVCGTSCTDDLDCSDQAPNFAYCDNQACVPRLPNGTTCDEDRLCASGLCVDGVCCNAACAGQCEACAEPDTEGTCVPVQGTPRGERPACEAGDADEPCSQSSCDGSERSVCGGFVDQEVSCRVPSCTDGIATLEAACDGSGVCPKAKTVRCNRYACAGEACGESCASDADCAAEFHCDVASSECTPDKTSRCSEDALVQENPDGTSESCSPYVCAGIACLDKCSSSIDCVAGYICNPETKECTSNGASAAADGSGCDCRASAAVTGRHDWLVMAVAIAGLARRRRRPKSAGC